MGRGRFAIERLEDRRLLAAELVADINPVTPSSNPGELVAIGDDLFFTAGDGQPTTQLWMTDGSAAGTRKILDLEGFAGNRPLVELTAFQDELLFLRHDNENRLDLWRSDGTTQGTFVWATLPAPWASADLLVSGDTLFIVARDRHDAASLWTAGDTADGITLLKTFSHLGDAVDVDGTLFFGAEADALPEFHLWKSDGSIAGTTPVQGVPTGSVRDLTSVDGTLFFAAYNMPYRPGETGRMEVLWRSDGTDVGTIPLMNDRFGHERTFDRPVAVGDSLYFIADFNGVPRLWKSDGTPVGTAPTNPAFHWPMGLVKAGGKLAFYANEAGWLTDGTEAGTVRLPATPSLAYGGAVDWSDGALVSGYSASDGYGIWHTDFTPDGIRLIKSFPEVIGKHTPVGPLVPAGGQVYFSAYDPVYGQELWRTDGTAAGTKLVVDLTPDTYGSTPDGLTEAGGQFFFTATYGDRFDRGLYRMDRDGTDPLLL